VNVYQRETISCERNENVILCRASVMYECHFNIFFRSSITHIRFSINALPGSVGPNVLNSKRCVSATSLRFDDVILLLSQTIFICAYENDRMAQNVVGPASYRNNSDDFRELVRGNIRKNPTRPAAGLMKGVYEILRAHLFQHQSCEPVNVSHVVGRNRPWGKFEQSRSTSKPLSGRSTRKSQTRRSEGDFACPACALSVLQVMVRV